MMGTHNVSTLAERTFADLLSTLRSLASGQSVSLTCVGDRCGVFHLIHNLHVLAALPVIAGEPVPKITMEAVFSGLLDPVVSLKCASGMDARFVMGALAEVQGHLPCGPCSDIPSFSGTTYEHKDGRLVMACFAQTQLPRVTVVDSEDVEPRETLRELDAWSFVDCIDYISCIGMSCPEMGEQWTVTGPRSGLRMSTAFVELLEILLA